MRSEEQCQPRKHCQVGEVKRIFPLVRSHSSVARWAAAKSGTTKNVDTPSNMLLPGSNYIGGSRVWPLQQTVERRHATPFESAEWQALMVIAFVSSVGWNFAQRTVILLRCTSRLLKNKTNFCCCFLCCFASPEKNTSGKERFKD